MRKSRCRAALGAFSIFVTAFMLAYLASAQTGNSPTIDFVSPTDDDGAYVNRTWTYINVTVNDTETPDNLTAFIDWNRSLVLWMRFNNESGESATLFRDWSTWGNDGSCSGSTCPTNTSGKWRSALQFDGVNDVITVADSSSLDVTDNLTIIAWIYPYNISDSGGIVGKRQSWNSLYGYSLFIANGYLFAEYGNATDYIQASKNIELQNNTWQEIAIVISGGKIYWYKNGATYSNTSAPIGGIASNSVSLEIGKNTGTNFNGTIDEIAVWNRALTPEEINSTFNAGIYRLYQNFTNLPDGTYTSTAHVQDSDGNVNQTETRSLTIDNNPPIITISSPLNVTYITGNLVLNTSFDSDVLSTWYSLDGGSNVTLCSNCSSSTQTALSPENPSNSTGLVGRWALSSVNASNYTFDSSDQGHDGQLKNGSASCFGPSDCPQLIDGKFGSALRFDGANDYVNLGTINISGYKGTISAWVQANNLTGTHYSLGRYWTQTGLGYASGAYRGNWNNVGLVYYTTLDNNYHMMTITYDGNLSQDNIKLYVDGTLLKTANSTSPNLNDNSPWQIGAHGNSDYFWNGTIDEVRIYNRSLSAEEIRENYRLSTGQHNITVWANNSLGNTNSSSVQFLVNTTGCLSGESYGTWDIIDAQICSNMQMTMRDGILVESGGSLNLNNVTLILYGTITADSGSIFNLNSSMLKMVSLNGQRATGTISGTSAVDSSYILSWDPANNTVISSTDRATGSQRGYLKFDGASVNITNSNLSYLDGAGIYIYSSNNAVVQNNTLTENYRGMYIYSSSTGTISNNTVSGSLWQGIFLQNSNNFVVQNNTIYNEDIGIDLWTSSNITVVDNSITNMTGNNDAYNVGIMLFGNTTNVTITNNTLIDIGTAGILLLKNNTDVLISYNYVDIMELNQKYTTTTSTDINEPETGISIVETYKVSTTDSQEKENDNRTKLTNYKSRNITISNNTFGPNVQVLLYSEGTENLTHDLSNYWLFSYYFPRLTDRSDLYISNSWNNLTSVLNLINRTQSITSLTPKTISSTLQKAYGGESSDGAAEKELFINYAVKRDNISIFPQGYERFNNGTVVSTDYPYDFYLYSPSYTAFGLNKTSSVYANGTTHIIMYDDLTEPNGYSTMNITVQPSSDYVNVTILNWSMSYKKWNESSVNSSVSSYHLLGDFPANAHIIFLKNGTYWNTYTSNSSGYINYTYNEGYSEQQFEAMSDTTPPTLSLQLPQNTTYASTSRTLNFTAADDYAVDSCWYNYNSTNTTISGCQNTTFTVLDNQASELTLYVNDTSGNMNSTTITFTIDTIMPFVEIILPENISYNSASIFLNYTATDTNLVQAWYEYNSTNTTLSGNTTFTALDNQESTITLYANDTAGNVNSTSVTLTIDTIPPTSDSPSDSSHAQDSQASINWTLSDNIAPGEYIIYRNSTIQNDTTAWTNNTALNIWINTTETGTWNYTIQYNDSAGNDGIQDTAIITITSQDTAPPEITFVYPTWDNNSEKQEDWAYINITLNENANASFLEWNNGTLSNYTMEGSQTNFYLNMTSQNGTITYKVYANDSSGNMNTSEQRTITLNITQPDTTPPQYSQNTTNTTYAGTSTLHSLYWQDNTALSGYIFSFDNGTGAFTNDTFVEMSGAGNWSNITKTANTTVGATIQWRIYANDTNNNWNTSDTYTYTTILTPDTPLEITINTPENQSYNTNSIWFNVTTNKESPWCGYSLDSAPNTTMSNDTLTHYYNENSSMAEGQHAVIFSCNDTSGNMTNTTTIYFTIDTTPPTIIYVDPTPENYSTSETHFIFINTTSSEPLSTALLEWNGTVNITMFDSGTNQYYNKTYLPIGNYTYRIYANDSADNWNMTETRWIYINYTPTYPKYSTTISNTTQKNSSASFSTYWTDDFGLSGYIFSTNNSGSWTNQTYSFTGTPDWSNVTLRLNSTLGLNIGYIFYANNTIGRWNSTGINTLTITCLESWSYSAWSSCASGTQTRTASDENQCTTTTNRSALSQSCSSESSSSSSGGGSSGGTNSIPPVKHECEKNTDCTAAETCKNYKCVAIKCASCEYIASRKCTRYECCSDTDCSEGSICKDNRCTAQEEQNQTIGNDTKESIDKEAENSIAQARAAIDNNRAAKNITDAEIALKDAIDAYEKSDYARAKELAYLAKTLAESAPPSVVQKEEADTQQKTVSSWPLYLIGFLAVSALLLLASRNNRAKTQASPGILGMSKRRGNHNQSQVMSTLETIKSTMEKDIPKKETKQGIGSEITSLLENFGEIKALMNSKKDNATKEDAIKIEELYSEIMEIKKHMDNKDVESAITHIDKSNKLLGLMRKDFRDYIDQEINALVENFTEIKRRINSRKDTEAPISEEYAKKIDVLFEEIQIVKKQMESNDLAKAMEHIDKSNNMLKYIKQSYKDIQHSMNT